MVDNAPTFLATMDDPRRSVPLLTDGEQSPTLLWVIVAELARLVGIADGIQRPTFAGAGHVPQLTHPSSTSRPIARSWPPTGHGRLGCHAEGPTGHRQIGRAHV